MVDDELYHYGVKGMKWGVRKDKQKYGMSKREVKRAIKTAKRSYRRNEDPYHVFNGTTGKNWANVRSKHRRAVENDDTIKELRDKRDSMYRQAERADRKGNVGLAETYQNLGDWNQRDIDRRKSEIGESFVNDYDDALLKDIGYSDTKKGREMLKAYGITNEGGRYH